MRVSIACDDGTFMFPKECPKGFSAKRLRGGKTCALNPRWPVSFSCFNGCFIPFFSCDEKKQKARHARKNSRERSLLISTSSIRSNARLPLDTSSGSRGAAELAPHGYLKKYIPALRSNILAQWPLTRSVSHSIFNGAGFRRWRRITSAIVFSLQE